MHVAAPASRCGERPWPKLQLRLLFRMLVGRLVKPCAGREIRTAGTTAPAARRLLVRDLPSLLGQQRPQFGAGLRGRFPREGCSLALGRQAQAEPASAAPLFPSNFSVTVRTVPPSKPRGVSIPRNAEWTLPACPAIPQPVALSASKDRDQPLAWPRVKRAPYRPEVSTGVLV